LRALVADDDADVRRMLGEVLHSRGARCVAACTGQEAFEGFLAECPDIIVSDIRMPDGDGFELIRRVRALSPDQGGLTPAVGISSSANAEQALMAGYHVLLRKPVDVAVLVHTLEEFFDEEREASSNEARWEISSPAPGRLEMTFAGYIGAPDARAAVAELVQHLEKGPCRLLIDLRRATGFSAAGVSRTQMAVWPMRHAIVHVTIAGGPLSVRIVASATCHLLGIGCTMEGPHEG
jgi:CheY-like chemotaxis protein